MTARGRGELLDIEPADPASAKRRGRPVASDGEATRRRVLDVARAEFAERGFTAATMRSIAAAADVTAMSLYNYADSKAALFVAVWDDAIDQIYTDYEDVVAGHDALVDEINAIIDHSRSILLDRPEHIRLVLRVLLDHTHPDLADANLHPPGATEFYSRLADRGVTRGEIHPDDREHLMTWIVTTLWGMTTLAAFDPRSLEAVTESAKRSARAQFGDR